MIIPVISIVLGLIYFFKPDVFRMGIRKTTTTTNQVAAKNYLIYIRILGLIFIAVGIYLAIKNNSI